MDSFIYSLIFLFFFYDRKLAKIFISINTILVPIVLEMYDQDNISPVARYNITMRIYLFTAFLMFKVFTVYEILLHEVTRIEIEDEKYALILLVLERVIFLSGILAEACLFQILIP